MAIKTPDSFVKNFLTGLTMSNFAGDLNNDITVAAGSAVDSGGTMINLSSSITKRLDANWVVGNNNGGLDTGSKAINTTYHVWLIYNPTSAIADVLFSTSASSPTMPIGYSIKRRIGSILTDGSNNIRNFVQDGDMFTYSPGFTVTIPVTTSQANYSIAGIPTGTPIKIMLIPAIESFTNSQSNTVNIGPTNTTLATPSWFNMTTATAPTNAFAGGGGVVGESVNRMQASNSMAIIPTSNGQIRAVMSSLNSNVRLYLWAWIDTRGREY